MGASGGKCKTGVKIYTSTFLQAVKDIRKGEEILVSYRDSPATKPLFDPCLCPAIHLVPARLLRAFAK